MFDHVVVTLSYRHAHPHVGLNIILLYARTVCVHQSKIELCVVVIQFSSHFVPLNRLKIILDYSPAIVIQNAKSVLS